MIEAVITISPQSVEYALFLLENIKKTISDTSNIKFILSHNQDVDRIDEIIKQNKEFEFKKIKTKKHFGEHAGECHGFNLTAGVKELREELGMMIDADCAFLQKNWDTQFTEKLHDDTVIIGTEYCGSHYRKFPNSIFSIFKTQIFQELKIELKEKHENIIVKSKEEEQLYGVKKGTEILLDMDSQLLDIKKAGYKGVAIPQVGINAKDIRFSSREGLSPAFVKGDDNNSLVTGAEYQMKGIPVLTHVGRSSVRPFSSPIPQRWKQGVEDWINNL
tara:strand:- start:2404 stop:3228 length:825 start_codon:yes stop_codon:yes gene_type:complete